MGSSAAPIYARLGARHRAETTERAARKAIGGAVRVPPSFLAVVHLSVHTSEPKRPSRAASLVTAPPFIEGACVARPRLLGLRVGLLMSIPESAAGPTRP